MMMMMMMMMIQVRILSSHNPCHGDDPDLGNTVTGRRPTLPLVWLILYTDDNDNDNNNDDDDDNNTN
jgi:hypothetical protein